MLEPLDEIIRDLIQSRVPGLAGADQVAFEPPDDNWRQTMQGGHEERVNVYLYEIREDLKYRSNARGVSFQEGWVKESRVPERLDCHFLITAWSPIPSLPPTTEPTLDEHKLLYAVVAALMANRPLVVAGVYQSGLTIPSGRTLASVPPELQQASLPLEAAMSDQIRNLGEFWTTMKVVWRPTIGLTVTIPVLPGYPDILTPPVTTLTAESIPLPAAGSAEERVTIGGRVLTGTGDTAVPGAWVQIQGTSAGVNQVNRRVLSRADGTYIIDRLQAGQYHLRTVKAGFGDIGRDVSIPSLTGEYDLRFP